MCREDRRGNFFIYIRSVIRFSDVFVLVVPRKGVTILKRKNCLRQKKS
jgi:hypothetical protein